jgi:GGDEF domain-containing protein
LQSQRGASLGAVSIMRDITNLRKNEFALKRKAETDSLTGLLNRDSFVRTLSEELRDSAQTQQRVSVMMIDLDKFKNVNDTNGHYNGDRALKAFQTFSGRCFVWRTL